jgi:hypothetical protein
MDTYSDVFSYIKTQENEWKTARIPLTTSKDWSMREHIERCTNVANGWYHSGRNDGLRRYDDIVTPIINVAFRSEGFDVKDIIPYVNDISENYKSFIVKKLHPKWARKHELDTFIDDVVETSVIYDLVLIKNVNNVRPEVVDLKTIAFCDQTDVMAGPICIKHQMTIADILGYKGKWDDAQIDLAIAMAQFEKSNNVSGEQVAKTPSKYVEVYELVGELPENWIKEDGEMNKYVPQKHIVCYYKSQDGSSNGITLFKGKDKPLNKTFKALKIDRVRSKGRACGKSIVETLFEPQVWANYDAQKIKELLDSAFNVIISDSDELGNQKLNELKKNTILKQNKGDVTQVVTSNLQNLTYFANDKASLTQDARTLGSASDPSLGLNPVSGTPLGTTQTVIQQGEGIHEYRQGKITTFFADVLYPEWILEWLVADLNSGEKFSEELTLDEMLEVGETIATNQAEKRVKEMILDGKIVTMEDKQMLIDTIKQDFIKAGSRKFFDELKDEFKDIPVDVFVNIKGKQRYMAQNADKITNILREILANSQAFAQNPGIAKAFNQVLEESGMSAIDFTQITKAPLQVENKVVSQVSEAPQLTV